MNTEKTIQGYDILYGCGFSTGFNDTSGLKPQEVIKDLRGYKYIVIHHTATTNQLNAEQMKMSMFYHWIRNKGFALIPTHYIVGYTGDILNVNDESLIVGAVGKDKYNTMEKVIEANRNGIHIEVVGDFNINNPTDGQYEALSKLIKELQKKYPGIQVQTHSDFASKKCPGTKFDFDKLFELINKKEFEVYRGSRYYSPEPGQTAYFRGSYIEDVKMNCGLNKDGTPGDCSHIANGHKLKVTDVGKVGACPSNYKGKTIKIDNGYGIQNFYCADVGSAITNKRLDIWCGYGQVGYDNIKNNTCKNIGNINVYF